MQSADEYSDRIEHLWILALSLLAVIGAFALDPTGDGRLAVTLPLADVRIALPGLCFSQAVLGVQCPGCGLTRSFVAFAHGRASEAVAFNPMGPFVFLVCLVQIPYRIGAYFGLGRESRALQAIRGRLDLVTWMIVVGLVAQWVIRMTIAASL